MGLGKTMQVITLLVAIAQAASSTDSKISSQVPQCLRVSRTLVLCPPGLINNWMDELLTWVPEDVLGVLGELRKVDASIKLPERLQTIAGWYEDGGVLVVGYEMFRALIENKKPKTREAALSEEQHEQVKEQLLKGPNIIIADEAHKMKNATAAITLAASQFR
jgi:SNF2 family DNA or RNA helicase